MAKRKATGKHHAPVTKVAKTNIGPTEENLKKLKRKVKKTPVLPIAAGFDEGIGKFKELIREAVAEASADK